MKAADASGSSVPTRKPGHAGSSRGAFTLIEILLAVAIFGIVLLAIHSVFHIALRLRNRTVETLESALPIHRTLAILRADIEAIVPPQGTFGAPVETTPANTSVGLSGTPLLQFHSASGIISDTLPWGDIQRVAYLLASPTNTASEGLDFVRAITRNLLPVSIEQIEYQRLAGGIESVEFAFHDGNGWRPTWNSTNEAILLPRAIRARFHRVPPRSLDRNVRLEPVELVVGLLIEPATNSVTSGGSTSTNQNQTSGGGA